MRNAHTSHALASVTLDKLPQSSEFVRPDELAQQLAFPRGGDRPRGVSHPLGVSMYLDLLTGFASCGRFRSDSR